MDAKFQALPPNKRLRLIQQLEEKENNYAAVTSILPAKKRCESREQLLPLVLRQPPTAAAVTTYSLPAKKRIWVLQPIDLNIEFNEEDPQKQNEEKTLIKSPIDDAIRSAEIDLKDEISEEESDGDDGILCAVCRSTDGDPTDPIVFCDGCDLMVHKTCYGDPLITAIPDGDWFCNQCIATASNPNETLSCCLCLVKGGVMKPTTKDGDWAHIVCALYVPEVFFTDPEGREGIDFSSVPDWRRKGKCCVCKSVNKGCVIDCSEPKCGLSFHVTCGLNEDLCIEYREGRKKNGGVVAGFCRDHTELWKKQEHTGKYKIVARE